MTHINSKYYSKNQNYFLMLNCCLYHSILHLPSLDCFFFICFLMMIEGQLVVGTKHWLINLACSSVDLWTWNRSAYRDISDLICINITLLFFGAKHQLLRQRASRCMKITRHPMKLP
jgi:hypothetical protein